MKPSDFNKAVARHTLAIFGGSPLVQNFDNENRTDTLAVMSTADVIETGITSIGTVGLSDFIFDNGQNPSSSVRVELCAAAPSQDDYWRNAVASAAFFIKKARTAVFPGLVVPDIFMDYLPDACMPHIYLTVPFLWNDGDFERLVVGEFQVHWLQCLSIHQSEMLFVQKYGSEVFEDLLQEQNVDIFDSERPAILFS